jgi:beta-galactosidase
MINRVRGFIFLIVAVCLTSCNGNKPAEESMQLFDLNWKYHEGDVLGGFAVGLNDNRWKELDLPHDWRDEVNPDKEELKKYQNKFMPPEVIWYRKKFIVPSAWQSKHISVYFEGVSVGAKVYINGTLLGENPKHSTSLNLNLTSYLYCNKENLIAVRVENDEMENNYSPGGAGIYKHVWLKITDTVYFSQ